MALRKGDLVAIEIEYRPEASARYVEWRVAKAKACTREGKIREAEYWDGADLVTTKMVDKGYEVLRVEKFLIDEVDVVSLFDGARQPFSDRESVRQFAYLCRRLR